MAIYPYIVNKDGVWYPSGTDVPEGPSLVAEETRSDEKKVSYTKSDISKMTTAELRRVAKENGIDNADKTTGVELKQLLVEKFGL